MESCRCQTRIHMVFDVRRNVNVSVSTIPIEMAGEIKGILSHSVRFGTRYPQPLANLRARANIDTHLSASGRQATELSSRPPVFA